MVQRRCSTIGISYLDDVWFEKWVRHQGEIVNILLKIKNSFLPTKQILIGL